MKNREEARIELQNELDIAKTQSQRNKLGQFATPSSLAGEIISYAVGLLSAQSEIRFLEPGFGTGPFFSALLRKVPASRIKVAVGYEIDPHYARPAEELWEGTRLLLHIDDFTKADPPKDEPDKYNLVVCNPPYVRHHHLTPANKRALQGTVKRLLGFELNGLSGLYTYFMVLSQVWMQEGGVGAWLVPSEFMDVNYGRKLKEFLLKNVTLYRIHRFDPNEVQFEDALVSSAVVFFKNSPPSERHKVEFTFGGTVSNPRDSALISLKNLRGVPKWTHLPQSVSRIGHQRESITLGDLFTIKRGLATGCNSFFMLTPEMASELKLPKEFLTPVLPGPRDLDTDEILSDNDGEPQITHRRYLLVCDLPEEAVKSRYPSLWQYLQQGVENGVNERYLCRHRKPWYSQEVRPPAPFLCTYMGRQGGRNGSPFRFILNCSKATAANVYLLLYPKPVLSALIQGNLEARKAVWKALASIAAEMLMGEGRVYGGGLHKLEPKELANVPGEIVLEALPRGREIKLNKQMKLFAK